MHEFPKQTGKIESINDPSGVPELSSEQFNWISSRVKQLTGIMLPPQKHVLVQSRIQRRLRLLKMSSFSEYLDYLQGPNGDTESVSFCNALTTNLTSFFRERHHFDHLESELKDLASRGAQSARIWSAGCSTGQEPYSIAISVLNAGRNELIPDTTITATDIDTSVLQTAKTGSYSGDDFEALPQMAKQYFQPSDTDGFFEASNQSKKIIEFKQANLMEDWPNPGTFDIIFCRNVMIYFDAETKKKLIRRFTESLRPKGVLYLGHSESVVNSDVELEMIGRTTFRRIS